MPKLPAKGHFMALVYLIAVLGLENVVLILGRVVFKYRSLCNLPRLVKPLM